MDKLWINGFGVRLPASRNVAYEFGTVPLDEGAILRQHLLAMYRVEVANPLLRQVSVDKVTIAVPGKPELRRWLWIVRRSDAASGSSVADMAVHELRFIALAILSCFGAYRYLLSAV